MHSCVFGQKLAAFWLSVRDKGWERSHDGDVHVHACVHACLSV